MTTKATRPSSGTTWLYRPIPPLFTLLQICQASLVYEQQSRSSIVFSSSTKDRRRTNRQSNTESARTEIKAATLMDDDDLTSRSRFGTLGSQTLVSIREKAGQSIVPELDMANSSHLQATEIFSVVAPLQLALFDDVVRETSSCPWHEVSSQPDRRTACSNSFFQGPTSVADCQAQHIGGQL
ncbi:hypothetical protein IWX49DRAFT_156152 [Phyllosticta citricarpa]|uniref:Uncharacterized protein n=1 Tax=Phyllosticta citricarpa TaxID=55181 RepID=A0ABR1MJR4_9PEZI